MTASGAAMAGSGLSPADTPFGAATRFLVELAAWIVIPLAVNSAVGLVPGVLAFLALIAATGTFNAAGDKRTQGVVVPGSVRLALEIGLAVGLVAAAAYLWGAAGLAAAVVLVVVAGWAGRRRAAWLLGRWQPSA